MPSKKSKSTKTTISGLASLALAFASIFASPTLGAKLQAAALLTSGAGLVAAKDNKPSDPTGTA